MSTLFLHIGMPKTGTSYIQKFLSLNNKVLRPKGYVYPVFKFTFDKIGHLRNGHFLVCKIKNEQGKRDHEAEKYYFEKGFKRVLSCFEKYPNVILSDESIWNSSDNNYSGDLWPELKRMADEHNFDVKIIVYLRRQDTFIQSLWGQFVKGTCELSFKDYVNGKMHEKRRQNYYERLNEISAYFGKENVIPRVYENQQYEGTDNTLISDFLKVIGIELTDEYQKPMVELSNTSLEGVYLETKRVMNTFPEFKERRNYLTDDLKKVMEEHKDSPKAKRVNNFTYDEQIAYLEKYKDSNSMVAKEYFGREDGILFRDEIKKVDNENIANYKTTDILETLGQVIVMKNNEFLELKDEKRSLQSTINWISTPFFKKVTRKLKRIFSRPKEQLGETDELC